LNAPMTDGVRLIVFGRQGAGKGTQAARLAERYGVPHISTGDMLRLAAQEGTEFGRKAKEFMDAGQLLPDDVMLGVVSERLARPDAAPGWLLDGFPRTPGQAQDLWDLVGDGGIDLAVDLDVPEDVVLERIVARRVCSGCGTTYSIHLDESARTGRCVKCGGEVTQRADDTEDAVRTRLAAYASQTEPLLAWYAERGLLATVDGVGDPDEINAELARVIDERTA
jgi:adenylate kinase